MSTESAVGEALAGGLTLPAGWYADRDVLARERECIFARSWQYTGRLEQVAEPGSFFAGRAGHVPVVVVRDRGGLLRGFVNVCRHRGHLVAAGDGRRETLQCPYHAWTYDLDGTLRRAPRSEREPGFDCSEWSLLPVAVDTWGPLVFVNPDPEAEPLLDALGELPAAVAATGLDLASLRFHHRSEYEMAANWKVVVENYLECYHCPVAHPGFSKAVNVDPDAYRLQAHERVLVQTAPMRANGGPGEPEYTAVLVFPNTSVDVYPGPGNLTVGAYVPLDEGRTLGIADFFFAEGTDEAYAAELVAFNQEVGREDVALVESVHAGLASGAVPHGRLLAESEQLVARFQRLVADALES